MIGTGNFPTETSSSAESHGDFSSSFSANRDGCVRVTRHIRFICFFLCGVLSSTAAARDRDLVVIINSREIEPYKVAIESLKQTLRGEGLDPILSERLLPDDPAVRNALLADI